jgi:hypothetical protein
MMPVTPADPPPRSVPASAELLVDRYLPDFDATIIEHRVVAADVATTWRALGELDLMQVHTPLMDAAFKVRGLPATVAGALGRQRPPPPAPLELKLRGDGLGLPGWLPLGEVEGQEIAFGAVGRFWQPEIVWYDVEAMTPEDFATFDEPGWGRIAASFSLRPYGLTRTLSSYEARTATPDPESAKRFRRYWMIVSPFVGHILRAALDALAEDAESRARRPRPAA